MCTLSISQKWCGGLNWFLGQNEIHYDFYVIASRMRPHQLFLNIFSETTTPREQIFGSNVPWVVLFKICSYGSEILNNFPTGSGKLSKIA
jgi:hypothetical protein